MDKNGPVVDDERRDEESKDWSRWSDTDSGFVEMEDAKLVRRIDWRLLPWMCVLYAMSLIDRFYIQSYGKLIKGIISEPQELLEWILN